MDTSQRHFILVLFFFLVVPSFLGAAESAPASKTDEAVTEVYKKGQTAYWSGNYAEAISLFAQVSAMDQNYRERDVRLYQALASYRVRGKRKGAAVEVYPEPVKERLPQKEVLISDEEEWLHLLAETESVLQDASTFLFRVSESGQVPGDKLSDAWYYLKQARLSFERQQYLDAIRCSHLAKERAEQALEEVTAPQRQVLGKVGDTLVTLNVTDLDLKEALKQIYDLTGVNIVLSAGISGKVTMNVRDIPLRQVLELIVDTNGLQYTEKEGVIVILTPEEYAKTVEGMALKNKKVYYVHYADAKGIAKVIRDSLGIEAVTADPRSNAIIVDAANTVQAKDIERLVKELDISVSQVLIEAQLLEVTYSDNKALGLNFLIQSRMLGDVRLTGPQWGSVPATLPAEAEALYFGLTHRDFSAIVNALATAGEVRLLQSPRVLTTSGAPAIIEATEEIPYSQFETTEVTMPGGVVQPRFSRTVDTIEVGTTFEVTPLVQNNRTVALAVSLSVSRVREMMRLPLGISGGSVLYDEYPLIEERATTQNVVLWDGESLVVGGIMSVEDFKSETRVPVLGKIPVLGHLFRRSNLTKRNTELILFLTPRIVLTYEEGRTLTREYQALPSSREPKKGILDQPWF